MATYYKVTTQKDALMLRKECSTSSTILAKMPKGTIVTQNFVLNASAGWIAVDYQGTTGFASASYLTLCNEKGELLENKDEVQKRSNGIIIHDEGNQNGEAPEETSGVNKTLIAGIAVAAIGALAVIFV